jgi:TM2 domain-containing membrane protein YozV
MIVYTCHQCKAQLQSPDSMSGSFITCPSCKSTLIVPGAPYRPAGTPTTTTDAPAVALTTPPTPPTSPSPIAATPPAFEAPAAPSSTAPTPPPIPPAIPDTAAAFVSPATAAYTPVTPPPTPNMPPPPPPFGATMYPPGMYPAGRPARVSRLIYVILAIFLGSFGVHNFAAGHTNTAIIQLIVSLVGILLTPCTFGITALAPLGMFVWAIVEAVTVTKDADGIPMP